MGWCEYGAQVASAEHLRVLVQLMDESSEESVRDECRATRPLSAEVACVGLYCGSQSSF